ncbi:formylglycine-generating enzyme family protein [Thiospirillum jenense]|uniref:SUMF1/EgtB/PvdO family nonheme iron enzyme n=1 Tax=Thiospirillum jenense TaxID=1653858 RepID=A0A839HDW6_9GAMM|nr:formylglycine-generating enzyme family protein [Thiospirillum jenense]MBB1127073.1 SUMF1/EgtB/PvdO family nonheme iron enzyme [Thiospirillum jenense]
MRQLARLAAHAANIDKNYLRQLTQMATSVANTNKQLSTRLEQIEAQQQLFTGQLQQFNQAMTEQQRDAAQTVETLAQMELSLNERLDDSAEQLNAQIEQQEQLLTKQFVKYDVQLAENSQTIMDLVVQIENLRQQSQAIDKEAATEDESITERIINSNNISEESTEQSDDDDTTLRDMHEQPIAVVQQLQRKTAKMLGLEVAFYHSLKDGSQGPEMLVIPPGRFFMGSARDMERPQHEVTIAQPFAIGRFTVTFAEYTVFCERTWRRKPEKWSYSQHPMVYVTWGDAQAYCEWLSEQTGYRYRLPSEAEWEYAARAATSTDFWWGNEINTSLANHGNESFFDFVLSTKIQTVPVKSFAPNPFGLYQVHGNVYEWCQDYWHDNYNGAPVDGSAWEGNAWVLKNKRVQRGGCWASHSSRCRSASRHSSEATNVSQAGGFRVCCDLD